MCGILALLGDSEIINQEALNALKLLIDTRGPDYHSSLCNQRTTCGLELKLKASVLHLRGDEMQKQPITDELGNALLFNGQIYEFNREPLDSRCSDTTFLSEKLRLLKSREEIANVFACIDGPFAFIYWSNNLNSLFYGRDIFGRKSLCALTGDAPYPYVISSVALAQNFVDSDMKLSWIEVDCAGFHCLEFDTITEPKKTKYIWNLDHIYPKTNKCPLVEIDPQITYIPLYTFNFLESLNADNSLEICDINQAIILNQFESKLLNAVSKRVKYNKTTCLKCRLIEINQSTGIYCTHSKAAVAFSGGIDSTVVALALDKIMDKSETIDLITVAFKENSPDRESVSNAFRELRQICPHRNWRLVLNDITATTLQIERRKTICNLISPCKTVIDDSLGCGCWFIGRGTGRSLVSSIDDETFDRIYEFFIDYNPLIDSGKFSHSIDYNYTSNATIFFTGMSIDEQLGGYSSHRAAWSKSGIKGVHEEISFQMRRLSSRNLGRDDRTFSSHARDVKIPYLDFDLVSFLNQLPISVKMNLDESHELGPKKLLRSLAFHWGLKNTSQRVKRAMQFGTRIANLENSKEKGNEICLRLIL